MKNIKKISMGIWQVLLMHADDCGIFPIYARVAIYGFLLFFILKIESSRFDATELITVVSFTSIVTIIESLWRKTGVGRKLIWHFAALLILITFLGVLLNQATYFRSAWYKTHVLENRIETLISEAPTAIIVGDGSGRIKYINRNATKLIGWTNEEIEGRPLTILMRPHKVQEHLRGFHKAVQSLKRGNAEWIYTGNHIFRIVCKLENTVKVQIYIVGIRYSTDLEPGLYPEGKDIEFYAILYPIEPLLDPDEAAEEALKKIDAAYKEDRKDKKEETLSK